MDCSTGTVFRVMNPTGQLVKWPTGHPFMYIDPVPNFDVGVINKHG